MGHVVPVKEHVLPVGLSCTSLVRFSAAVIVAIALTACGGGSSGSGASTPTPISLPSGNGNLDLTSVVGIDINQNGVRDDVEIAMAKTVVHEGATWQAVLRLARLYQSWIVDPTSDRATARARLLDEYRAIQCMQRETQADWAQISPLAKELSWRTFSTENRIAIKSVLHHSAGPFIPPVLGQTC